jgi:hypothetical protein
MLAKRKRQITGKQVAEAEARALVELYGSSAFVVARRMDLSAPARTTRHQLMVIRAVGRELGVPKPRHTATRYLGR